VKSDYHIDRVNKSDAADLLLRFHYLKDISKTFKSGYNYGLYKNNEFCPLNIGGIQGVCIFTGLPVPEIAKGAFGLERNEQQGLFELSRLCIHPDTQQEEYNITSWFVSRAIKQLRKDTKVRAIISYADSEHHGGTIYRACNFRYCGLSDPKKDFYFSDGTKHSRGKIGDAEGEWRDRSRKHRYVMVFDKSLELLWTN
jgi:hypothetical protein|tara:strand:+ start:388 stop:981 length:594 start_codon:yes stop_codon:yes gene_type:complete